MKKLYALALLAVAGALVMAGCGGSDNSSGGAYGGGKSETASESSSESRGYGAPTAAPNAEEGTTFVSLASVPKLGMILVDAKGFALYDFEKDQGTTSSCYGACAEGWPPLLTKGAPKPSNGAKAGMLGTTERKDGTTQVTYAGHPLYLYVGDAKPGEANGNDVDAYGAEWYALKANGEEP